MFPLVMTHTLLDAIKAKPALASLALAQAIESVIEYTHDTRFSRLSAAQILETALSNSLALLVDGGLVGIMQAFDNARKA